MPVVGPPAHTAEESQQTGSSHSHSNTGRHAERQADTTLRRVEQEAGAHAGHEHGGNGRNQPESGAFAKADADTPQRETGQKLIAPTKITPDNTEINL